MVSNLAKAEIEKMWQQGLHPTVEDICDINTLGIILEKNGNSSSFYSAPRMAFLGDLILHEPSVEKQIYIDKIRQLFSSDDFTCLYALVYAMNTDFDQLPQLDNTKTLTKAVKKFTQENLMAFTHGQMMAAVSYALHGFDEETLNSRYNDISDDVKQAIELPKEAASMAQMLLNKAIGYGLDAESCKASTVPQLERVLAIAAMRQGADILKDESIENTGNFYRCVGKIRARLLNENKQTKEDKNGEEQH